MMNKWKRQGGRVGRDISKPRGVALAANAATLTWVGNYCHICFDEMAHMQQEGESSATAASVYDAAFSVLVNLGRYCDYFLESGYHILRSGSSIKGMRMALGSTMRGRSVAPLMFTFQFPSWVLFEGYQGHLSKYHRGVPFRKAITQSPDCGTHGEKGW